MAMRLVKINKIRAKKLWDKGVPIIFVGNKVSPYHFFEGWRLASEHSKPECLEKSGYEPECKFESLVNSFYYYLDPELGNRIAFYVRAEHIGK